MKNRTILFALCLATLLAASLFSYSRSETVIHNPDSTTTSRWFVDGAALATVILCIALFLICRRVSQTVRIASRRAGLPDALTIPIAARLIIVAAIPFQFFGYGNTYSGYHFTTTFEFGMSPFKLPVFLLVLLFVWLVALLQRLRLLSEHLKYIA